MAERKAKPHALPIPSFSEDLLAPMFQFPKRIVSGRPPSNYRQTTALRRSRYFPSLFWPHTAHWRFSSAQHIPWLVPHRYLQPLFHLI